MDGWNGTGEDLPASNGQAQMLDIMEKEVELAIKNLKRRKAPEEDNITAEMIKAGEDCSVEMLHRLCNQIYYTKECPKEWDKAIVVPLHKKGYRTVCSNYRATSLVSVPGKVCTRVLQRRLRRWVEEAMSEKQARFRKGTRGATRNLSWGATFLEQKGLPLFFPCPALHSPPSPALDVLHPTTLDLVSPCTHLKAGGPGPSRGIFLISTLLYVSFCA